MVTLWQDLRYGARQLRRSPGFTAVAVLTLALGIGANTAIFSLVNALLLRPLPGQEPGRLVSVYTSDYSGPLYGSSSYPDFVDFRERNQVLSRLAAYTLRPLLLTHNGESVRIMGEVVSVDYFDVLGLRAAYGRTFLSGEGETPGAQPVVVLSHGLWQRYFGADAGVVSRTVRLNGKPFTVIGVGPEDFTGMMRGMSADLWVPLAMWPTLNPGSEMLNQRSSRGLLLVGRLKPGATVEQAQANFRLLGQQLYEAHPNEWDNVREEPRLVTVLPENEARLFPAFRGAVLGFMGLLMVVVGLVLLIACANVANLLLSRATGRRREIAIRLSLGASRLRLVRQLLTESVLLALLAGAAGVGVALWTTEALMAFKPPLPFTLALDLNLDTTVLGFTVGLSILTGVLFGLAPALQASKPNLVTALKDEGAATRGTTRSYLRNTLVVAQVAVSFLLLIGSGLFLRSLANADAVDPGFDPENILLVSVDLGLQGYSEAEGQVFFEQLQERLEALPQVESTSVTDLLPLGWGTRRRSVSLQGYEPAPGEDMEVHSAIVGPGYFETLRAPLVRGRSFTKEDTIGAPGVIIVNEAFARRYWPGQEVLGKRMALGTGTETLPLEVIGVAKTGKYHTLGEDPLPFYFLPHRQNYGGSMTILARTSRNPHEMVATAREQIRALDANLPAFDIATMNEHMGIALLPVRLAATLLGVLGALALVLAAVGIYGVISYSVSRRRHEIGVRMALGASRRDVLKLVIRQGMAPMLVGMGLGLAGAFALTRFLTFLLYGISPTDAATFVTISVLLGGVALLACYLPARRAMRVEPMVALRYE